MTQSATIDPPVHLTTPEVDIDLVRVVDGFNPRKLMDKTKLAQMASSMGKVGMLKPLLVVPVDDHFELVAGERRLKAAQSAGLRKVPITLRTDKNRELMTAVENTQVEALDPVATARSWKMVAEAFELRTNRQIAETVDQSVDSVGAHMRLLRLPEGVQVYFAEGVVNLDAERPLREVSKISPRVAECVCEVARREKVKPSQFVDRFEELLQRVPEAKFDDPPAMIPVAGATLDDVVVDVKLREELLGRLRDLWSHQTVSGNGTRVRFSSEQIDQARAARVLLEYKGGHTVFSPLRFICDAEFAGDLADRWVAALVKQSRKDRKDRERADQAAKAAREGVDPSATDAEQADQRRKAEAKRKREEAKASKQMARSLAFNEDIGRKIARRHGKRTQQRADARFDVLVDLLFTAHPRLGAGLRLVLGQLRQVHGEKVTYASVEKATAYLRERIGRADSVEEKIELVVEAIVADQLADVSVLPPYKQWEGGRYLLDEKAEKALGPDVKALTPAPRSTN